MRLLLIEDDPGLSASLSRALRDQRFAVDSVPDGETGLSQLSGGDYQLAILDIVLPGRDGLSVCSEARKLGISTPILMLTARDSVADRVSGLNTGADDYLAKPFAFPELLARIHALLRRPLEALRPRTVEVGDLSVDVLRHRATSAGRVLQLTKTEYRLLLYLLTNAGMVLTKDSILERLWGTEHDGSTNLLEVYIKLLRRKIDDGASGSRIRTVRGVGYTIDKP
ncbi:MAG: response regulator transcription factor [Candidatus Eremiobacteraeota bacterium]|nr:response regulator transcription factor [Candidatus Eremiobacteraeota bacterium]MBC5827814.1 response regulator transcription factor [Candidatus Eremiobacteraeota bacterium]